MAKAKTATLVKKTPAKKAAVKCASKGKCCKGK